MSVRDDGISLGGSRGKKLVALAKDAAGLLPLIRIAHADLIKDVEEDLGLDNLLLSLAERSLGLLDDTLELIHQAFDPLARKVLARHPSLLSTVAYQQVIVPHAARYYTNRSFKAR